MTATRADFIRSTQQRINEQCTALLDEAQHLSDWPEASNVAELADFISTALGRLAVVAERIETHAETKRLRRAVA